MDEKLDTGEVYIKKNRFSKWFENFWYHYKWHSLIALFLVFTITVCTLQMCEKEKYDAYILYAGGHAFARESSDGDFPEYVKAKDSIERFVSDYDGNGESNISFRDLYTPTESELKEKDEESFAERAYNDRNALATTMMSGDFFLCFFAPEVFENYNSVGSNEASIFCDLTKYIPDGSAIVFYEGTKTGILLSSLDFYKLPGISALPSDTVIAIRNASFSSHLDDRDNNRDLERAIEIFQKILAYDVP